jgi:hypothetical protein
MRIQLSVFVRFKVDLIHDGQQFHKYRQNEQSPHLNLLEARKKKTMTLEIQLLAWDRHKNVATLSQLMGSQLFISKYIRL